MTTAVIPAYRAADELLAGAIRRAVHTYGVPTSIDAAHNLSAAVMPDLLDARGYLAAREAESLRALFPNLSVQSQAPWYPETALQRMTLRSAGLAPNSPLTRVELYSEAAQKMMTVRAAPWTLPDEEAMLNVLTDRLVAGAGRHARSASRDLVIATAKGNSVPWARQLNGESCTFCAMLVSRGAVYSEKSVRFPAHDHCDCTATLAPGDQWEGVDQAALLREAWTSSDSLAAFGDKVREVVA